MKAIERGAPNKGLDNLFNFWSTKIRENLTSVFGAQKLLSLIDELDQKIEKYESKKKLIDEQKKSQMIKDRFSVQLDYKTVIKKSQKDLKQAKSESISNRYNIGISYTDYTLKRDDYK